MSPFFSFFIILVAVIVFSLAIASGRNGVIKQIAAQLKARPRSGIFEGNHQGVPYHYRYTTYSKGKGVRLRVSVHCIGGGDFRVVQENPVDRFFKTIGLNVESQTGDSAFDSRFYLLSNAADFTRDCFREESAREAVRRLFAAGYKEVWHDGKTVSASRNQRCASDSDAAEITQAVPHLAALSRVVESAPAAAKPKDLAWLARVAVMTLAGIGAAAAFPFLLWAERHFLPLDEWQIFVYSLRVSAPVYLALALASIGVLRGRAYSHREFLVVCFLFFLAVPVNSYAGHVYWNGQSSDESVTRTLPVTRTYTTRSKRRTSYHVEVRSWREGKIFERFAVGSRLFRQLTGQNASLKIATRRGALGHEWIESLDAEIQPR